MNDSTIDMFNNITSNITSFSHAYLFDSNSLDKLFPYVKNFAKRIICSNYKEECNADCNICHLIDENTFDDLYIVNPDSISISTSEIDNLMNYMETKSIRENGKRVYIIYGFERLREDVSNKILKFLEEPNDNIYALLMTENIEYILPTIISRCQVIKLNFTSNEIDTSLVQKMNDFLDNMYTNKTNSIAYVNDYWTDLLSDRNKFYDAFEILEKIFSNILNYKYTNTIDDIFKNSFCLINTDNIINILNITNYLKNLVKKNINLNLLIDRYIIEITRELNLCKE